MLGGKSLLFRLLLSAFILAGLGACATRPPADDLAAVREFELTNDPFEPANRIIFNINGAADTVILRPIAGGYRAITPKPVQKRVSNFYQNLEEPWTFINALLQGKVKRGFDALGRFVINTTVGIGGLFDPATKAGIQREKEDFGQTLATWGVGDGFYVVLPFFGPSNVRDSVGLGVEFFAEPVGIGADKLDVKNLQLGLTAGEIIDIRARNWPYIEELRKEPDPYITARSAWRQNRRHEITDGSMEQTKAEEELFEEEY